MVKMSIDAAAIPLALRDGSGWVSGGMRLVTGSGRRCRWMPRLVSIQCFGACDLDHI